MIYNIIEELMKILNGLIEQLIIWIHQLGWIGVFAGVILESIIVPIPSPLIPMGAGFILIPRDIPIYRVIYDIFILIGIVGAIAATIGSYVGYYIGYFGGEPFIKKYGNLLGVKWSEIANLNINNRWRRNIKIFIFLGRMIPIVPLSLVSIAAGIIKIDFKTFTTWTLVGCLPRYFILGISGWILGIAYEELSAVLESAENALLITVLLLVGLYAIYKYLSRVNCPALRL